MRNASDHRGEWVERVTCELEKLNARLVKVEDRQTDLRVALARQEVKTSLYAALVAAGISVLGHFGLAGK